MAETVILDIQANSKNAEKNISNIKTGLKKIERQGQETNNTLLKLVKIVGGLSLTAGIAKVATDAKDLASRVEEIDSKLGAVFGSEGQKKVNEWASAYSKMTGLSRVGTKEAIGNISALMKGYGMTREKAFDFSKTVVKITNDLASFNDISKDRAKSVMASALRGESASAEQLNVSLLESQMNVSSLAMGLGKYSAKMDEVTKYQIRLHAILRQSKTAIGDMMRSQDTYNAQSDRLKTNIENVTLAFGQFMLPAITKIIKVINSFFKTINENISVVKAIAFGIGVAGGALLIYGIYISHVTILTKLATVATAIFNAVLGANPIGIIIILLGTLAGHFYYISEKATTLKDTFKLVWYDIKIHLAEFVNYFIEKINILLNSYNTLVRAVGGEGFELLAQIKIDEVKIKEEIKEKISKPLEKLNLTTYGSKLQAIPNLNQVNKTNDINKSYFQTFHKTNSPIIQGSNEQKKLLNIEKIIINVNNNNNDNDSLLEDLKNKISNEFVKAAKLAGII